jgi:hypothetical protein
MWLHFVSDAEVPQVNDPGSPGFLSVASSGPDLETFIDPLLKVHGEGAFFPYRRIAGARLRGDAPAGTRLTFRLAGFGMQTYEESLFNLRFALMDDDELQGYFGDAFYRVLGSDARHLFPVAPTCVAVDEPFDVPIVVRDRFGNKSGDELDELTLRLTTEDGIALDCDGITYDSGRRLHLARGICLPHPGVFYLLASADERPDLSGTSNPVICREEWEQRVLWGDLHQHAYYADGRGTPAANYEYASSTACLDFCSVCPHQIHTVSPPMLYLDDPPPQKGWDEMVEAARYFNDHGLITVLGSEVNAMRGGEGDMNSYYLDTENRPEIERLRQKRDASPTERPEYEDFEEYLSVLEDSQGEVLLMPHAHAGGGPGRAEFPHRPYITNVEACSVHGNFEDYYRVWLRHGWKVGIHGGGDNHMTSTGNARPGNHYPNTNGLTGAWSRSMDRRGVWNAYKNRRTYAVTGNQRIYLECRAGDARMGNVAEEDAAGIGVLAAGTAPILSVELIRNNEPIRSHRPTTGKRRFLRLLWTDNIRSRRTDSSCTTGEARVEGASMSVMQQLRPYNRSDAFSHENDGGVRFRSNAYSGSWRGFIAEIEGRQPEALEFKICDQHHGQICLQNEIRIELDEQSRIVHMPMDTSVQRPRRNFEGERELPELTLWVDWIDPEWPRVAELEWDVPPGPPCYVRVRQIDGNEAWSSAIWWERQ